ncbi:MAG TPA: tetratricopeptide repeat protein [Gammaproteobacteria bacterium]|nr:tetratricopeptide repeat protein [Gammaproteobacteria bacterium]
MSIEKKTTNKSQTEDPLECYKQAIHHEEQGKIPKAILNINKLLRIDHKHRLGIKMREKLFYAQISSRKMDLHKMKKAEQSIEEHRKSLKNTTLSQLEQSRHHRHIGDGYLALALYGDPNLCRSNYHNALLTYTHALSLNTIDATIYYGRGKVYFDLLQYYDALQDFTKAIEINPEEGLFYNIRCNVYVFLEEGDLALQDARLALKYNPKQTYALQVLHKLGTDEEVISISLAILEKQPNHQDAKHFFEKKMGKSYEAYKQEKEKLANILNRFGLLAVPQLNSTIAEYVVDKALPDKIKLS